MAALLDVNALIALVDSDHVRHKAMRRWFVAHSARGWATCPVTENGLIRVVSQPAYPSGQRTPAELIQILRALKNAFLKSYQFWPDDVYLSDETLFKTELIVGTRQVTDVYLLGLAAHRGGTLVSFDQSLPWQAIQGGSEALVELPV